MRYLILMLCLVQIKVQASDWLNRTVRVDLLTNRKTFVPLYDTFERSETMTGAVNATNGQYPWSVLTTAWAFQGGFGIGITCSCSIISNNFALSTLGCVGRNLQPPVNTIELSIGSVRWNSTRSPTNLVQYYWYITPSSENSPNIVLFRLLESLTFNPNVQAIRLPSNGNFSYDGWSSYILGFQTPGSGPSSAQLSFVQTSILKNSVCDFRGNVPDFEICGKEGSDPSETRPIMRFNAFSGGAWIAYEYTSGLGLIQVVLIGIHQFQFANQTASYGYATRVSHFVEWIHTFSDVEPIK